MHVGHILTGDGIQLSILEVVLYIEADCDTDHYLVVAEVRERLLISKGAAQHGKI
jgi:hypothetical protein